MQPARGTFEQMSPAKCYAHHICKMQSLLTMPQALQFIGTLSLPNSTCLLCDGVNGVIVFHAQVLWGIVALHALPFMDKADRAGINAFLLAVCRNDFLKLGLCLDAEVNLCSILILDHKLQSLSPLDLGLGLSASLRHL